MNGFGSEEEGLESGRLSNGKVSWRGVPLSQLVYTVLDVETTGLSPRSNGITEICCLRLVEGQVVGRFSSLLNPGQAIPPFIQRMTGITDAMVRYAPRFGEIATDLLRFLEGSVLVAHNAPFDLSFLNYSLCAHGHGKLHHPVVDTLKLSRRLLPGLPRASLDAVTAHLGISNQSRHRAQGDAEATAELLLRLLSLCRDRGVEDDAQLLALVAPAASRQRARPLALPQAPAQRLAVLARRCRTLPDAPGVYTMRSSSGRVLYVGKAISLRKRLASYFNGGVPPKIKRMLAKVESIEHLQLGSELEALLEESRLIKLHQPPYNSQLRTYLDFPFIKLEESGPYPRMVVTREVDGEGDRYFGPFRNTLGTEQVLETLLRCFRLFADRCPNPCPGESCIYLQMGRCLGPCLGPEHLARYRAAMDELSRLLESDPEDLLSELARRRDSASERLDFETAALYRDAIESLERALDRRRLLSPAVEGPNVLAVCPSVHPGCAELFVLGDGRLLARERILPGDLPASRSAVESLLGQVASHWAEETGQAAVRVDPKSLDRVNTITRWLEGRGEAASTITLEPGWPDTRFGEVVEWVVRAAQEAAGVEER